MAEQVGREILESKLELGAWATALDECGGRKQEALATYARLRVRAADQDPRRIRMVKNHSFESRRLAHCMGDKGPAKCWQRTIEDMLNNSRRGIAKNFMKPRISVSMVVHLVRRHGRKGWRRCDASRSTFPEHINNPPIVHRHPRRCGLGLGSARTALLLPKRWITLGWNTGIVVTCNVLCLTSLFLGTKLIKRAIATGTSVVPAQEARKASRKAPRLRKRKPNGTPTSFPASKGRIPVKTECHPAITAFQPPLTINIAAE